jgi:hypothetical protein
MILIQNNKSELMHEKKKRLLSTVKAISFKGIKLTSCQMHPGIITSFIPNSLKVDGDVKR